MEIELRDVVFYLLIALMIYVGWEMVKMIMGGSKHVYIGSKDINKQPHGKGKLVAGNGDIYEGEFVHGKMHGYGVYKFSVGGDYKGEFLNGLYHGKGIETYSSGAVYIGDFYQGVRTGIGRMNYPDESWYFGSWLNNKRDGNGIFVSKKDSTRFKGHWENGKQDGPGVLVRKEGKTYVKLTGIWNDGVFNRTKVDEVDPDEEFEKEKNTEDSNMKDTLRSYEDSIRNLANVSKTD